MIDDQLVGVEMECAADGSAWLYRGQRRPENDIELGPHLETLSSSGFSRRDIHRFATLQFCGDVAVGRQEPSEVALDHVRGDQAVATNPQTRRNPRSLAD